MNCVTIPLSILNDDRLTRADLRVYGVLAAWSDREGRCGMTRNEIETACQIKCAGQAINKLVSFGYVALEKSYSGTGFKIIEKSSTAEDKRNLASFAAEYVAYLTKTHSPKYARDADRAFRKLQDFAGDVLLDNITPAKLETFFAVTFKRAQFETAKNYRTLKAAFNRAVEWDYMHSSPFKKVRLPRLPNNIPVFLTESELAKTYEQTSKQDMRDIFTFAFHTGMRLSEIINLEWEAVDLSERTIKVSNSETFTTKSKKERIVPVNDTNAEMLRKRQPKVFRIGSRNYVFAKSPGVKYAADYVSRQFKKAVRAAGLDRRLHFHSIRHSTASQMVRRGVPIAVVKEILGHSDISTTMIYSHIRQDDKLKAVKVLEGCIVKIGSKSRQTWIPLS